MKVILQRDVTDLGQAGDVVDVADGYGHNFLLRTGLASRATRGAIADAENIRAARHKQEARNREEAEQIKAQLEAHPVQVGAKAGEDGTLYGSVGNGKIAEAIRSQLGLTVDRKKIPLPRPLKSVGEHEVTVKLHSDVDATVRVEVVEQG